MSYWKAKSFIPAIVISSVLPACSIGSYIVPKSEMDRIHAASAEERSQMVVAARRVSDRERVELRVKTIDVSTARAKNDPRAVVVKATAMSTTGIVGAAVGTGGLVAVGIGGYLLTTPCPERDTPESFDCSTRGAISLGVAFAGIGMNIAGAVLMAVGLTRTPQEFSSRGPATAYGPQVVLVPGGVGFRTSLW